MFGTTLDWIFAAAMGIMSVLLLLGKGDFMLKSSNEKTKKRTKEEHLRYSRMMGIFTAILAVDELVAAMFPDNSVILIMCPIVALVDVLVIAVFAKKYF